MTYTGRATSLTNRVTSLTNEELRITSVQLAIDYLKGMNDSENALINLADRIYGFLTNGNEIENEGETGISTEEKSVEDFPF